MKGAGQELSLIHIYKLKELLGDRELEQMKKDMAVQKAVTLVADEACLLYTSRCV